MKKYLLTLLTAVAFISAVSADEITLKAKTGKIVAQPIAIVPFKNNTSADKIDLIVSTDLKKSGVFAPINPSSYSQRPTSPSQINFDKWSSKNIPYVVVGQLRGGTVNFVIADTFKRKILGPYKVKIGSNSPRMGAHKVADAILKKLTGTRGSFATRLAYIYESGRGTSRTFSLMVSDSDGKNAKTLLKSKKPIASPRFSPNGRKLTYVTYEGRVPEIVTHDVLVGKRGPVSAAQGVSSPSWSSDGKKIAFVASGSGNPEIYIKNLSSGKITRVTNNKAIDTEPTWSPSGGAIYFTSDRSGSPQLYKIILTSGKTKKISHSGRDNSGADISPNGKKLAIATSRSGKYQIGTVNLSNSAYKAISKGTLDETPRFSPNGQMLIYTTRRSGREVLKIVNVDGTGEDILSSSGHIRDPDWSTFID